VRLTDLLTPWPPALIGGFLFAAGLALGLLFATGGCTI
jgi:hypothetical protein